MNLDLVSLLMAVAFTGTRIAGLMTFAPFLSSSAVPLQVKAGLTMVLTALVYPLYGPARLTLTTSGWILVMCREAVIGLLLGLTLQFIFDAVQLAGQVLGVQMGFSLVNVLDLLCRMSSIGHGYAEQRQVNFQEEPGFALLIKECPSLGSFDWARFTFGMDSYVEEVRRLVSLIYRTQ